MAETVATELGVYFKSASQLAKAVGTSRDTLRAWSSGHPPARPRIELLNAAQLLLTLCRATRRYVGNDLQVGEWLISPNPRLDGASPAQFLRRQGHDGLDLLLADLAVIAPERPSGPIDMPPLAELRAALETGIGTKAMQRIEHDADRASVQLSDAEIDAELETAGTDEQA